MMIAPTMAIGSDFATVGDSFRVDNAARPWELDGLGIAYYQTGRHALGVLARILLAEGRSRILVPSHCCDSMLEPFASLGWEIVPVPLTSDFVPEPDSLVGLLDGRGDESVVLLASLFGRVPGPRDLHGVALARQAGAVVIDDETHRVLTASHIGADYAIGSLRKTLPVADGAYVRAADVRRLPTPGPAGAAPDARWLAMDLKARAGDARELADVHRQFVDANAALESEGPALGISARTDDELGRLNYELLSSRRASNARLLAELAGSVVPIVNRPADTPVPSHLVISVAEPRTVRGRLAREGVFCPIHWERSTVLSNQTPWRDDVLSIPIDHRYGDDDMHRVARALAIAVGT